jgi:hypothetical protein
MRRTISRWPFGILIKSLICWWMQRDLNLRPAEKSNGPLREMLRKVSGGENHVAIAPGPMRPVRSLGDRLSIRYSQAASGFRRVSAKAPIVLIQMPLRRGFVPFPGSRPVQGTPCNESVEFATYVRTAQEPLLRTMLRQCCMESPAIERNPRKLAALRGTALSPRKDAQARTMRA